MNVKPKAPRYMWLIPVAMLILAALACDDYYVPPPMVDRVEADAEVDGRVYARVVNIGLTYGTDETGDVLEYESHDYGTTWRHSEHVFAEEVANRYPMTMYGEMLEINGYGAWSFPRSMFRTIFYDAGNLPSNRQLTLPDGFVSNAAHGDTLYVAMGTEGVLVAHLDDNGLASDWKLSANGIDAINPLPLTITEPTVILGIVLLIFFVPPFALIHAYLLQRVWVYVLPSKEARQLAFKVTAGLVVLAIIGSVFWLTNDRTDLYQVLAVLSAITAIIGLTVTVLLAQKAGVSDFTRNRLAIAAFFVSLIIPAAVAAIFALWWLVFGLVFAYWAYQRAYYHFITDSFPTSEGRTQRWRVDRVTLEMMVMTLICAVALFFVTAFLDRLVFGFGTGSSITGLILLLTLFAGIGGIYFLIRYYGSKRIFALDVNFRENRDIARLPVELRKHTIYWMALALVATVATFFSQAWVYGWFTTLLK